MAEVEESVRGAVMKGKRKAGLMANGADAKKLKIWMGKRKMGESDSDDSDEDDAENEEESEKSVILNVGRSDLNKDAEGSSDSVNYGKAGDGSGGSSCESGSEEEKDMAAQETMELVGSSSEKTLQSERVDAVEMNDQTTQSAVLSCPEAVAISAHQEDEVVKQDALEVEIVNSENVSANHQDTSNPNSGEIIEDLSTRPEPNGSPVSKLSDHDETTATVSNPEIPLNFDDFSSATEMEVLGLGRLKSELQARGLKCGGTLQERAARLFLLKSTPLDKLPKKLLARK